MTTREDPHVALDNLEWLDWRFPGSHVPLEGRRGGTVCIHFAADDDEFPGGPGVLGMDVDDLFDPDFRDEVEFELRDNSQDEDEDEEET